MNTLTQVKFEFASVELRDAFTDFWLSRQAMQCTAATMAFYKFTAGKFIDWLPSQGVNSPGDLAARHIRMYLAELATRLQSQTVHDYARALKTLCRFLHKEGYTPTLITFDMPRLEVKELPVLTIEEVQAVLKACKVRERAIFSFLVDSGVRRMELAALSVNDVDMNTGLVKLQETKGRKFRTVIISPKCRRYLLAYLKTAKNKSENAPLFQTLQGNRVSGQNVRQILLRLSRRVGIPFTAHTLRRTACTLMLRSGASVEDVRRLFGWADLTMLVRYARINVDDLAATHNRHSPLNGI